MIVQGFEFVHKLRIFRFHRHIITGIWCSCLLPDFAWTLHHKIQCFIKKDYQLFFFFYLLKSIYYSEPCLKQLENFIWQFHPLRKKPNPQTCGRISSWNIPAKWINICLNQYLQQETRGNADTRGTFLEYTNLSIFHPKCTVTSLLFRS